MAEFVSQRSSRKNMATMFGNSSKLHDPELGYGADESEMLLPGISKTENALRWGFIRKVYGIVGTQLTLTALISFSLASSPRTVQYLASSPGLLITLMILPFLGATLCLTTMVQTIIHPQLVAGMIPLHIYKNKHPVNLIILGVWTALMSVSVGMVCTAYAPMVVLEAVLLTAGIVFGLTAYTFYATRKGADLTYLAPFLFASLWGLIIWGFLQVFFPVGPVGRTIYALFGAVLFSGYIVLDTHLLIARMDLDDYIWASVALWLDIINLFLKLLQLLGNNRD